MLVVDVIGVNDKVSVGEYRHTTAYHVIEHFALPSTTR